jgi:hypothetical protein
MRNIEQKIVDSLRFAEVIIQNDRLWIPFPKNQYGQIAAVVIGFKDANEAHSFCVNLQNSKVS